MTAQNTGGMRATGQVELGAVSAPLIEACGLTKHYDGFSLQGVCLAVEPGQIVGFIGQNGAGKSTTIKALLGLIGVDAGEARILGVSSHELSGARSDMKERIGVVFDTVSMPPHIKIAEISKLMARAYNTWDQVAFEGHLRHFKLDAGKTVKELSRGMGMKLSLACALAHDPQVLILDEATAGLDPMARDEVLDMLRDFVAVEDAAGNPVHAVLMSSHITSDLDKIADEVVCIDEGRIMFSCAKDEICDLMGVARCRAVEVEQVLESPDAPAEVRVLHHDYGIDVLIPDRFEFMRAYPDIPCDRVSIDDYMALMLKGAVLHPRGGARKGGDAR